MNEISSPIQLRKKPQDVDGGFNANVNGTVSHMPIPDCTRSSLADICLLLGIEDIDKPSDTLFLRRRVKAGQWIFSNGQKFDSVFIVYSGAIKTVLLDEVGNEQILSFPLRGDLLGLDGLHENCHPSQAVALTDCEVIVIPFGALIKLSHEHPSIATWFYCAMSRALAHEHALMGMLSTLCSEARVARFLISLSERYKKLGGSATHFSLPMTRQEIGSYLGMTFETVSRALSALQEAQFIDISRREVILKNLPGLLALKKIPSATTGRRLASAATATLHALEPCHNAPVRNEPATWLSAATQF